MKKNVVLFGAGAHAHVIIDILEKQGQYQIAGIIDSKREIGELFDDYKIIGRQEKLKSIVQDYCIEGGIVCVGDNYWRGYLVNYIKSIIPDFNFVNAIHPNSIIGKGLCIGVGNAIMAGVIIDPYVTIKNHCIININSSLGHFSIMEDFSSLSGAVMSGGYVHYKEYSAVSLGVILFDRLSVGKHSVIGAGSLVTKDIEDGILAYGNPAKKIRNRKPGDKYLK